MKDNVCNECEMSFVEKKDLRVHVQRVHERLKNHVCSGCNKGFFDASHLRNHAKTAGGCLREQSKKFMKLVNCPKCDKSFSEKSLKTHIKNVHEDPSLSNLKRHMNITCKEETIQTKIDIENSNTYDNVKVQGIINSIPIKKVQVPSNGHVARLEIASQKLAIENVEQEEESSIRDYKIEVDESIPIKEFGHKPKMAGVESTCKNVVAQLKIKNKQSNANHNNFKDQAVEDDDSIQIKVNSALIKDVSNEPKKHSCSICHKNFPCPSKLKRHINGLKSNCQNAAFETVTESKNFQCKVCKMNFTLRQDLKEHLIKIHITSKSHSIHSLPHKSSQF